MQSCHETECAKATDGSAVYVVPAAAPPQRPEL